MSESKGVSPDGGVKRRRKLLSLENKVDILQRLDAGVSVCSLCDAYDIGSSTVYDIKKHRKRIMRGFASKHSKKAINIKKEKDEESFTMSKVLKKSKIKQEPRRRLIDMNTKLEILEKLEKNVSVKNLRDEYGVGASTIYEIKYSKEKLTNIASKTAPSQCKDEIVKLERMKNMKHGKVNMAVYDWYKQQCVSGVPVRAREIKNAALRFAEIFGVSDFCGSHGWLTKFMKRHDISIREVTDENAWAEETAMEPFCEELLTLMQDNGIHRYELYNADEMGLCWKSLPENAVSAMRQSSTPKLKGNKLHVSVLLCANADGSHKINPMVVGNSKRPHALRNVIDQLPVFWRANNKAWFTNELFRDWFHQVFVPSVQTFQMEQKGIPRSEVKALLLLDNVPAHPSEEKLQSCDGRIKVKFFPPSTTPLIHPLDQGTILTYKRYYRRLLLKDVLVMKSVSEGEKGTNVIKTLKNLKDYNILDALKNLKLAWNKLSPNTLISGWRNLLVDNAAVAAAAEAVVDEPDLQGFEVDDIYHLFVEAKMSAVTEEDVQDWLEVDDLPYGVLTQEEMAKKVNISFEGLLPVEEKVIDEDVDMEKVPRLKPGQAREYLDELINFVAVTDIQGAVAYHSHLRELRRLVVDEQERHRVKRQCKAGDFFTEPNKQLTSVTSYSTNITYPSTGFSETGSRSSPLTWPSSSNMSGLNGSTIQP